MASLIPLSVPNLHGNEQKYMDDAIAKEWVSTGGDYINRLEEHLAAYVHAPDAVACQSGTAGLHLAMLAAGLGPGQEILVPTLTFIASVNPVMYVGAQPVFMDCDDSLCMDLDKLEQFCREECVQKAGKLYNRTSGNLVAAILIVHIFGNLADMDRLLAIASQYGLLVIEDAAEALGSFWTGGGCAGKYAGTVGDIGIYSFNGNKIITTGGGGMVVAKSQKVLDHIRYLSTQAKDDPFRFVHNQVGYNYRMTNIQAALGVGQMEQLETFIETKTRNFALYNELGIALIPFRPDTRPNYWFYSHLSPNRDALMEHLEKCQIQVRPIWHLIHALPPYRACQAYRIQAAQTYWEQVVNLPCSTNLPEADVRKVANAILEFEQKAAIK